jgi:hypothetical protein
MLRFVKPLRLAQPLRAGSVLITAVCILGAGAGTFAVDCYCTWQRESRRSGTGAKAPNFQAILAGGHMAMELVNPSKLRAGEPAPNFTLATVLDQGHVQLAAFRGRKPVVLLFGSFGCDLFCTSLPALKEFARTYGHGAKFLFVYVSDGPHAVLPPFTGSPPESRSARIQRGLRHFGLVMPCLVDGSDHAVEKAYNGFPRRLVVVDRGGNIALDLGKGLHTAWNLDDLERWLKTNATR